MDAVKTIWVRAMANRPLSLGVSAAVVVFGILLIAIGEVLEWGWTRLIGAGIISFGAVAFGVIVGWSDPVRPRVATALRGWSRGIVLLLTLIMVAPLFVGYLLSFGGLIVGGSGDDWWVLLLGVLIIVFLLGVTAATVAVALTLALQGLNETAGADADAPGANGRSDR
jgi:hypothetical protein